MPAKAGLYECLLTERLRAALSDYKTKLQKADQDADLLFALLYRQGANALRQALASVFEERAQEAGAREAKALLERVVSEIKGKPEAFAEPLSVLLSADEKAPLPGALQWSALERPATTFSETALFTGTRGEPVLLDELRRETLSAERADWLVSFLKMSGLRPLMDTLEAFAARGGKLRIVTTTYVGATDPEAVIWLAKLPNAEVYVSYDSKETRHHAKTYLFHRLHGLSTAYAGSANLSHAALSYGLEWTVKVTEASDPVLLERMQTIFASYVTDEARFLRFDPWDPAACDRLFDAIQEARSPRKGEARLMPGPAALGLRIEPYPFQRTILEKLEAARTLRGETRSLVVAATGTGKTMIAAFDYRRQVEKAKGAPVRLLFVAHREEILIQALSAFRFVMGDMNFGELYTGRFTPKAHQHVFMSVQTANSQSAASRYPADYFDYIVVDEFHHAEAQSYQALLDHFEPKFLLGLTATPYRGDGRDVLSRFNGHITAELSLGDAIDRQLLVPFEYLMVTDPVALESVRWRKGDYDAGELERLYTEGQSARIRDAALIGAINRYLPNLSDVRGLIFCVGRAHAAHITALLKAHNIQAETIDGTTEKTVRRTAPDRLRKGEVRFLTTVDVYNEGVDIPEVNTVLFLRPTASPTIFLQQLGRGLRLAEGKLRLTVLDFVGQMRKEFSFAPKLSLLMREKNVDLKSFVEAPDASLLPLGCTITLERQAMEAVLSNLKQRRSGTAALLENLRAWAADAPEPLQFADFLAARRFPAIDWPQLVKGLVPDQPALYFEDVLAIALPQPAEDAERAERAEQVQPAEPVQPAEHGGFSILKPAKPFDFSTAQFRRLFRKNGRRSLEGLLQDLENRAAFDAMTPWSRANWVMFAYTLFDQGVRDLGGNDAAARFLYEALIGNAPLCARIESVLTALHAEIDFVSPPAHVPDNVPIELHALYSSHEAAAAFGFAGAHSFREGIATIREHNADLFFVTIDKAEKQFALAHRYEDYAMNANYFHWQSQAKTREESEKGRRYKRVDYGNAAAPQAHLFVREKKEAAGVAQPFVYLGRLRFVSSTGECPMSIVWALETPIPARWLDAFTR